MGSVEELIEFLKENKVRVRIGLRQQGHLPTIDRMLAEGASWDQIGEAIGWHGPTAKVWYERERVRKANVGDVPGPVGKRE